MEILNFAFHQRLHLLFRETFLFLAFVWNLESKFIIVFHFQVHRFQSRQKIHIRVSPTGTTTSRTSNSTTRSWHRLRRNWMTALRFCSRMRASCPATSTIRRRMRSRRRTSRIWTQTTMRSSWSRQTSTRMRSGWTWARGNLSTTSAPISTASQSLPSTLAACPNVKI